MRRMIKPLLVFFTVMGMVGMAGPAYSEEKAVEQPASISAEVVSVDLKKSSVVIKQLKDPIEMTYENKTISVLAETKILKDDNITALKLSDLKFGDKITVNYTIDAAEKSIVKSIIVKTAEDVSVEE